MQEPEFTMQEPEAKSIIQRTRWTYLDGKGDDAGPCLVATAPDIEIVKQAAACLGLSEDDMASPPGHDKRSLGVTGTSAIELLVAAGAQFREKNLYQGARAR